MSTFVISTFKWEPFADLVGDPDSGLHTSFAEALLSRPDTADYLPTLPKDRDALARRLRDLLTRGEWFLDQSDEDRQLMPRLVEALINDNFPALGLEVTHYGNCGGYEVARLISGEYELREEASTPGFARYRLHRATPPRSREIHWLGNRPFRHGAWEGSDDDQMEYEQATSHVPFSIHTPDQVKLLLDDLDTVRDSCGDSPYEELREGFRELAAPIEQAVRQNHALYSSMDY